MATHPHIPLRGRWCQLHLFSFPHYTAPHSMTLLKSTVEDADEEEFSLLVSFPSSPTTSCRTRRGQPEQALAAPFILILCQTFIQSSVCFHSMPENDESERGWVTQVSLKEFEYSTEKHMQNLNTSDSDRPTKQLLPSKAPHLHNRTGAYMHL